MDIRKRINKHLRCGVVVRDRNEGRREQVKYSRAEQETYRYAEKLKKTNYIHGEQTKYGPREHERP